MNPQTLPLRDIQLPPAPAWWPPAPGWWLLAALLTLLLGLAGRQLWRAWQRRRRTRARLALLEGLLLAAGNDPAARARAASEALRRVVRAEAPAALRLQGEAWLAWLDQGLLGAPFAAQGKDLLDAPYRPRPPSDQVDRLVSLVRERLRRGLP